MEDVLAVYARPYGKKRPVVCMDEKPYQLLDETCNAAAMKPGTPQKEDYQYIRTGTCSIFIFTGPLAGWRYAESFSQRTKPDWANRIRWLLDEQYPEAEKVVLVVDNLNTHAVSSLYNAFPPRGSISSRPTLGNSLHAQAWELAKYCRS